MGISITAEPHVIGKDGIVVLRASWDTPGPDSATYEWTSDKVKGTLIDQLTGTAGVAHTLYWKAGPDGVHQIKVKVFDGPKKEKELGQTDHVLIVQQVGAAPPVTDRVRVTMQHADSKNTRDEVLWEAIREGTERISFPSYADFIEEMMCSLDADGHVVPVSQKPNGIGGDRFLPFSGVGAYELLKVATEVFLMSRCNVLRGGDHVPRGVGDEWLSYVVETDVASDKHRMIPYLAIIRRKLRDVPLALVNAQNQGPRQQYDLEAQATLCEGILARKLRCPLFLELIWSFWHEEGMLVQTMNAISLRFQNRRHPSGRDPLANFEIDPLRPLNNLLWGYIQDEQHRLTVARRNYEYDHHYGLRMKGRAIPPEASADSRTKFMDAFHELLRRCADFYRQDDETTVIADGFPVLNALKEVHLILSEGAHNQYGDLPWTARQEMLMQQWILARPEMREFLPTRIMVAYPEAWMDRVDAMKKLQGWSDNSVIHYRNLGKFGEQILLSVRFGAWSDVQNRDQAANWARAWRSEVQGYIHAVGAVSGVDLSAGEASRPLRLRRAG